MYENDENAEDKMSAACAACFCIVAGAVIAGVAILVHLYHVSSAASGQ